MQEITNKRMQILDPLAYRTRPACRLQHQTLDHLEQNPNNPGATNFNSERGDAPTRSWDRPGRRGYLKNSTTGPGSWGGASSRASPWRRPRAAQALRLRSAPLRTTTARWDGEAASRVSRKGAAAPPPPPPHADWVPPRADAPTHGREGQARNIPWWTGWGLADWACQLPLPEA